MRKYFLFLIILFAIIVAFTFLTLFPYHFNAEIFQMVPDIKTFVGDQVQEDFSSLSTQSVNNATVSKSEVTQNSTLTIPTAILNDYPTVARSILINDSVLPSRCLDNDKNILSWIIKPNDCINNTYMIWLVKSSIYRNSLRRNIRNYWGQEIHYEISGVKYNIHQSSLKF